MIESFINKDVDFAKKFLLAYVDDEGIEHISILKRDTDLAIKYLKDKFPTTDDKIISEIIKKYIV